MENQSSSKPKKFLGQHFLTSSDIARGVVEAACVQKGDAVLEIGPGEGVLTRELLAAGARVVAVEKDTDCIGVLENLFAEALEEKRLTLIEGDILEMSLADVLPKEFKVVANIPYYITGEIIRFVLSQKEKPSFLSLLVQKEVAERIARDKKESILSLSVKAFGKPKYVRTVKAGSFFPKPKVDSAILAVEDISNHFFDRFSEHDFFLAIKTAFGQKRKQIAKTLGSIVDSEELKKALGELSIQPTSRQRNIDFILTVYFLLKLSTNHSTELFRTPGKQWLMQRSTSSVPTAALCRPINGLGSCRVATPFVSCRFIFWPCLNRYVYEILSTILPLI